MQRLITQHLKTALIFFGLAALLGTYLRAYPLMSNWTDYRFVLHTHSHIALIGWVYLFSVGLLLYQYADRNYLKQFKRLYAIALISILGMMVSFPIKGYALWSILFSTLFLMVSYLLIYWLLKAKNDYAKKSYSFKFIKSALFYLGCSSIGPWALGIIMAMGAKDSIWYQLSVYFYLHFQLNGWMLFVLFGLFYALVETWGVQINTKSTQKVFYLLHLGVLLSFFSNTLWTQPPIVFHLLTALGGILLLWSLKEPYQLLIKHRNKLQRFEQLLLVFIASLLLLKSIGLISLGFPYLSELVHQYKDLIIAFIHMNFIGIVSLSLFWFAYKVGYLKFSKLALSLLLIGFVITELLLVFRPLGIPLAYHQLLSIGSLLIALGIILFIPKVKRIAKATSQR